ncbi:glycoside hydrolase family 27 protein [Terriglobus albidus]|uniref:glycoside hydrolase family 27 protein n=1 Tax=Terriglobus albidus TaxID=1592106 RepID=UPI0021DF5FE2|nr:glycoside hydrolase family 27 protein [Terriglobus albidus]
MKFLRLLPFVVALPLAAQQRVALTPPMGWNSWNHFAGRVTDADVRAAADAIVSSGMKDAGYIYVNIDDTWEGKRDANGVLHTNEKFPDMKALGDYIHSKGLKFGIYSSPGPQTCARYEGSYQHEEQDAKTWAEWGVDYIKYDLCSYRTIMREAAAKDPANGEKIQSELMRQAYQKISDAIRKTGRPMVLSLCQYGWDEVWTWAPALGGNLWRTTGDISDSYLSMSQIGFSQAGLSKYAGPGHWNDPDMLEIGNGRLTAEEYRTHMSLWCLLAAPLLAGNDLSKMTDETKSILLNKEAIAIDQDTLGKQGDRIWAKGALEVWAKPLSNGKVAVGLFNRSLEAAPVSVRFADAGAKSSAKVRDVWAGKDLGTKQGSYTANVAPHGVVLLVLE